MGFMLSLLNTFEKFYTILALVFYSGGPITVLVTGGASQGDGATVVTSNPIMRSIYLLSTVWFAFLLGIRWKKTLRVILRDRFIVLLALFTFSSVLWSAAPFDSFFRAVGLIGATLFGIYIASQYSLKEQIVLIAKAYGVIIVLSILYAVLMPQYGIMGGVHAGAWRGIYTHKNTLGMRIVLGAATYLVLLLNPKRASFWPAAGLLSSVALIVLCTSKSSLINLIVMFGTTGLCTILRWQWRYVVPLFFGSVTVASVSILWALGNLEAIAEFLNKDITLTGRTDIWKLVVDSIHRRPWLGYGYDAFWSQGLDGEAAYVWRTFMWNAPHAHNGFLDIWIQLGFFGVALLILGLYFHFFKSLIQLRCTVDPEYIWPILLLVYTLVNNLTETTFLKSNDLLWVLYTATTLQGYITVSRPKRLRETATQVDIQPNENRRRLPPPPPPPPPPLPGYPSTSH